MLISFHFRKTFHLLIIVIFFSCAGTKPEWTYQLKEDHIYIQGVGISSVKEKDYREKAFNSAENEIARQLKVEIKSTSTREKVVVLSKTVKDRYTDLVQTSIQQSLNEVKKIDEFRDKEKFYVLLGLDREVYFQRKKAEREQALDEIKTITKSLNGLKIDEQLLNLNKAIGLILKKDLLYEKDQSNNFLYTNLKTSINKRIRKLSAESKLSILNYNPLLQNKLSIPISIRYDGTISKALPIKIILDGNVVMNSLSNDRSTTELIIEPKSHKDQIVSIFLSELVFGEDKDSFIDTDLDLGGFIIRPILGDLDFQFIGPLLENQKSRLKSSIEQYLFSKFKYENSLNEKTRILISLERFDKPRYGEQYPHISICSGSIAVSNGTSKNILKIENQKGVDFEDIGKAFDNSINTLCKKENIAVIFENN